MLLLEALLCLRAKGAECEYRSDGSGMLEGVLWVTGVEQLVMGWVFVKFEGAGRVRWGR